MEANVETLHWHAKMCLAKSISQ